VAAVRLNPRNVVFVIATAGATALLGASLVLAAPGSSGSHPNCGNHGASNNGNHGNGNNGNHGYGNNGGGNGNGNGPCGNGKGGH
jgi:hypothetical protein